MRATLRWLCAGTLAIGAVTAIGCEKKSETTTTSTPAPTTMESAKQSMDNAATKAADETKKVGGEMKEGLDKAADKTKDAVDSVKK